MANLTESATWEVGITQLETTTQVLGGPSGPSNTPLKQLANRTLWLKGQVEGKSALGHGHAIAEIAGLQAALDGKSALGHGHAIAEIAGLQTALDSKTPYGHAHAQADITGLAAALAGKSDTGHGHGIAAITGLQTALEGKAASSHGHAIGDITNLQTTLDGKASTGHTHDYSSIYAALSHTHTLASLGAAAASHSHAISSITGLQAALDGKSATGHTHSIGSLTGTRASVNTNNLGGYSHSDVNGKFAATTIYVAPTFSTKLLVVWSATLSASSTASPSHLLMMKGTGTKPEIGNAAAGTILTNGHSVQPSAANEPETVSGSVILDVTPGEQIWLGMLTKSGGGGTVACSNWSITAVEL